MIRRVWPIARRREVDALYAVLYQLTHDLDNAVDLVSAQTRAAFAQQWRAYPEGDYLLTDPWFRDNVTRILTEEELQLRPEWFDRKEILDAGCGNGRWSYGFARLGASLTSVDVNPSAIDATRRALEEFDTPKQFVVTPLEDLSSSLPQGKFDLVFCWGVLHHCRSFNQSLHQLIERVKDDGLLYLYLYSRESIPYREDLDLFKARLHYNSLADDEARRRFLLEKAHGDETKLHNVHDIFAPLINRRLEWDDMFRCLTERGFEDVTRTIDHSELFIRAIRGDAETYRAKWLLPRKEPPYWFDHH